MSLSEGRTVGTTGQVTARVDSADELLAVAVALEREAAARYRALSARMARQGDASIAAQFNVLAGMEDRHASNVAERGQALLGHAPALRSAGWDLPPTYDEEEARGATLGAYQALAFAVRNEERAFVFYTYVAAEAEDPEVRALAEELARDELEHAALLRHHRRRAFHTERPHAVEIPQSVDVLRASAQRWDCEAAAAHAALAKALDDVGETEDAAIFRRLAAEEEKTAASAVGGAIPRLRSAADGLRLLEEAFDRFALIGEKSNDEQVVAEAQRLAGETIARLALAGGARSNTLLGVGPR
jgi:rubrerythrin